MCILTLIDERNPIICLDNLPNAFFSFMLMGQGRIQCMLMNPRSEISLCPNFGPVKGLINLIVHKEYRTELYCPLAWEIYTLVYLGLGLSGGSFRTST